MSENSQRNEGIQADSVHAQNIVIGKNATLIQVVNNSGDTDDDIVSQLKALLEALKTVPDEHKMDAEAVEVFATELVEKASQEKVNRGILEISAEGLKKAAQTLVDISPSIVAIASKLISLILANKP